MPCDLLVTFIYFITVQFSPVAAQVGPSLVEVEDRVIVHSSLSVWIIIHVSQISPSCFLSEMDENECYLVTLSLCSSEFNKSIRNIVYEVMTCHLPTLMLSRKKLTQISNGVENNEVIGNLFEFVKLRVGQIPLELCIGVN
jgi:hypothetical protein